MEESRQDDGAAWETEAHQRCEEAVLGACLIDPNKWVIAAGLLTASDFYHHTYRTVFQAMEIVARRAPIDIVLVSAALRATPISPTVLSHLVDRVPWASNVEYYAKEVAAMAERRRIDITGRVLVSESRKGSPPGEIVDSAIQELQSARRDLPTYKLIMEAIAEYMQMETIEDLQIPTGTLALDRILGGYRRGSLYTIGATTSVGKSAFMLEQAVRHCENGGRAGFISLELTELELAERILSRFAGITAKDLLDIVATQPELISTEGNNEDRVSDAILAISQLNLHIAVAPTNAVQSVAALAERMATEEDLDFLCIDYVQLLTAGKQNQVENLTVVTRTLKGLAVRLDIPIMIGAQINRQIDARDNRGNKIFGRPQLSQLRGGGSIEQDSDVVLLMWRDVDTSDVRHIHVAKNRQGPTGDLDLQFVQKFGHFIDMN